VLLKPVAVVERSKAWDELMTLVNRPTGQRPEQSDEEVMEEVVKELKALRRENDQ
jgi:hypothetical protein